MQFAISPILIHYIIRCIKPDLTIDVDMLLCKCFFFLVVRRLVDGYRGNVIFLQQKKMGIITNCTDVVVCITCACSNRKNAIANMISS